MRLIGYVRVSTQRQGDEDRQGLPTQERAIRRWARAQGHRLIAVVPDVGVSGRTNGPDRVGLAEAINLICAGKAEGLVVHRLDRLARQLTVQEAILAHVWQCAGAVFTVDAGEVLRDDPEDPMRTFVRQVMGAAAELERAMIAARLRGGRRTKAERGGFAYGAPPYGYKSVKGSLVKELPEQRALERMRALRSEGQSLRAIALTLTREGHSPRRGEVWHPTVLATLLRRDYSQAKARTRPRSKFP
jgi:DNA invertase Pin-like site-specific DNA recombinase